MIICIHFVIVKVYRTAQITWPKVQRQIFVDQSAHVLRIRREPYKASRLHVEPSVQNRNSRLHPPVVMQRLVILSLLLACSASLGICAVILEDGMPYMWAQTASQLTDLPSQNGVVTPNPWNYLHRLSMLRLLIAATDPYMGSMGTNATDSPLWGLPLQLAWMLTSGELQEKKSYPTEMSVR